MSNLPVTIPVYGRVTALLHVGGRQIYIHEGEDKIITFPSWDCVEFLVREGLISTDEIPDPITIIISP